MQQKIHDSAVEINARGSRLALAKFNSFTMTKFGKPVEVFLHDQCERVANAYADYKGPNADAAHNVLGVLHKACSVSVS